MTSENSPLLQGAVSGHDAHWYLLACKPRQDARAVQNLRNQGVKTFFPEVLVKKIIRGKRQKVTEPLFPGYLFINISPTDPAWSRIRSTYGVRDWVRFGTEPAKVPLTVINCLLNNTQLPEIDQSTRAGEKVTIRSGPFAGLEAVFQEEDGDSRSFLLIEILGKQNRISVANDEIERN